MHVPRPPRAPPSTLAWLLLVGAALGACFGTYHFGSVGGPMLAAGLRDGRRAVHSEFSSAVGEWAARHRQAFSTAPFRLSGPIRPGGFDALTLSDDQDAQRLRRANPESNLKFDYPSARKGVSAAALLHAGAISISGTGECRDTASCQINVASSGRTVYHGLSIRPYRFDEVLRTDLVFRGMTEEGPLEAACVDRPGEGFETCAAVCRSKGDGFEWRAHLARCIRSQRLAGVCIQVSPGEGSFVASPSKGCFGDTVEMWERVEEVQPTWVVIPPHAQIEVRSAKDPLLVAHRITGGTLDFGPPAADLRRTGGLYLGGAVACFVALVLLSAAIFQMWRDARRRTKAWGPDDVTRLAYAIGGSYAAASARSRPRPGPWDA